MKKVILFLIILFFPIFTYALNFPTTNSKVVEVYDLTDKNVIYEIKSNETKSIASLTKIATCITAIENNDNLDKKVTITRAMLNTVGWEASKAGLKSGDVVTYRDLLYATMLPSGADAANSLAISTSGSIDKFVQEMNKLSDRLNMRNTHFVNVTGLDIKNHYSTADDIRILLEYALNNEEFRKIYTTRTYRLSNGLNVKSTLNTYSGTSNTAKILGSKTGFTNDAGYCLSSLSNINSHEFIVIVLNAEHKNDKYYNIVDTINLVNFLGDHYRDQILIKKDDVVKTIPVVLSKTDKFEIKAYDDIKKFLPDDYDKKKVTIKYNGIEELSFTNKVNQKIGTISYLYDDKVLVENDVILSEKIEISFKKIFLKYYYLIIGIPLLLIIIIILGKRRKKKKSNV